MSSANTSRLFKAALVKAIRTLSRDTTPAWVDPSGSAHLRLNGYPKCDADVTGVSESPLVQNGSLLLRAEEAVSSSSSSSNNS
mmetsp:Transcript_21079/g.58392  ORF Transcript_21079/g.58392 Transcript_21079/m.58392 type:complete len:83 (-) Transcript_21079:24-272(-)